MNQNTENALKEAFSLIEAGKLDDAKALLRPVLESEKDSADVWWLYSHAVTDSETARLALNNVLRIDPNYPDANELLGQLEAQQKSEQFDDIVDMGKDPAFIPAMPSTIPGITPLSPRGDSLDSKLSASEDDLPDDMFSDEEPEAFYRRPLFYIPIISLLLIAALAIVIFKPFAVNSPATLAPQITQSSPIETPTNESLAIGDMTATPVAIAPTDTAVSAEAAPDFTAITNAFSAFKLTSDKSIEIVDTSLGKTLTVTICTVAGKQMRELLPKAMDSLAKPSIDYASQAPIASVKMLDCATNATLLWIGANTVDSTAYVNGTLAQKEYQAKWKPVK